MTSSQSLKKVRLRSNVRKTEFVNPIPTGLWNDVIDWGGSNHPAPILRLISWQNWLLTAQNLFSDEYFDLCPSIDTKNSLFICILLPLWAVKCRRSKIKFFKLKKVKISNFELLKCFIPQKKAENMYNSDLARKGKISCKKNHFFSIFQFFTKGSRKFLTFNFPKLSKKIPKMTSLGPVRYWEEQSQKFWWAQPMPFGNGRWI